jgi:hypothetical protein
MGVITIIITYSSHFCRDFHRLACIGAVTIIIIIIPVGLGAGVHTPS